MMTITAADLTLRPRRRLVPALIALLGLIALLAPGVAHADLPLCSYSWTNTTTESNWDISTNWSSPSGQYVPGSDPAAGGQTPSCQGSQVTIGAGAKVDITQDSAAGATRMTIASGAQVYINAGSQDGVLSIDGVGTVTPSLSNAGQIRLAGQQGNRGIISSNGTVTNQATGLIIGSGGTAGNIIQGAAVVNHGTIEAATSTLLFNLFSGTVNTNDGTLKADSGATLALGGQGGSGDEYDLDGGTVIADGTVAVDDETLVANAGTITGAVTMDGGTLEASGTGSGTFAIASNPAVFLGSDIAAGYTVSMPDGGQLSGQGHTNHGTVSLTSGTGNQAYLTGALTNASDGTFRATSQGGANPRVDLQQAVTNSGTMEITAGSVYEDHNINQVAGTLTVDAGASFDPGTLDISGGSLVNHGSIVAGSDLNATGGAMTGNPPTFVHNVSLTGGSGVIDTQNATLTTDIPSGYEVIVDEDLGLAPGGGATRVVNHGTVDLRGATSENPNIHDSALDNQGTVETTPSNASYRVINSAFTNEGTMDIAASLAVGGGWSNAGTITVSGASTLEAQGSSFTQSSGSVTLRSAGDELLAPAGVTINGGTLGGAGSVQANVANHGTVAPSPGAALSVTGDYTQGSDGFLASDVEPSGIGTLHVSGTANVDGTLQVATGAAEAPTAGQTFTVVDAGTLSGTFATVAGLITGPYSLAYSPTAATLTAQGRPVTAASTVTIGDATVAKPAQGSTAASFTLTLAPAETTPVTVTYVTANGTAAAPDDYQAQTGTVTFAPGQTTATISVPVFANGRDGASRTFFVDLGTPSGASLGNARGTGTILGRLSLDAVAPATAGNRGTTVLTLTGAGFSSTDHVTLTAAGKPAISATAVTASADGRTLSATVSLDKTALGSRTVTISSGSGLGAQSLANALRVEAATAPQVVATVEGPDATRPSGGWFGQVFLDNLGNTDAVNTLVQVDGLPSGVLATVSGAEGVPTQSDDGEEHSITFVVPRVGGGGVATIGLQFVVSNLSVAHHVVASIRASVLKSTDPGATSNLDSALTDAGMGADGHWHGTVKVAGQSNQSDISYEVWTAPPPSGAALPMITQSTHGNEVTVTTVSAAPQEGCYVDGDASADTLSWNCDHLQSALGYSCLGISVVSYSCSGVAAPAPDARRNVRARVALGPSAIWETWHFFKSAQSTAQEAPHINSEYEERLELTKCLTEQGYFNDLDRAKVDSLANMGLAWSWGRYGAEIGSLVIPIEGQLTVAGALSLTGGEDEYGWASTLARQIVQTPPAQLKDGSVNPLAHFQFEATNERGQLQLTPELIRQIIALAYVKCHVSEYKSERKEALEQLSGDPNDMSGPAGPGSKHYLSGARMPYTYRADFQNKPSAGAAAFRVTVTDQLDRAKLNVASATLGPVTFGTHTVVPPPGRQSYSTQVDLRPASNQLVDVSGAINARTGLITWTLEAVDPVTHQPVTSAAGGFLPPDKVAPEGRGSVSFTAYPTAAGLRTGARTANLASIVFDTNAAIRTPAWVNVVDRSRPTSRIVKVAHKTLKRGRKRIHILMVKLSGKDTGSGVAHYDVLAARGHGRPRLASDTSTRQAMIVCQAGTTYRLQVLATDRVGNTQAHATAARTVRCS